MDVMVAGGLRFTIRLAHGHGQNLSLAAVRIGETMPEYDYDLEVLAELLDEGDPPDGDSEDECLLQGWDGLAKLSGMDAEE